MKLIPVVLASGVGSRLWPVSRESMPKQFIQFEEDRLSSFQQTVLRMHLLGCSELCIVTQRKWVKIAETQIEELYQLGELDSLAKKVRTIYVAEPHAGGTTVSIHNALASIDKFLLTNEDEDVVVLITPSDHHVQGEFEFILDMNNAVELALDRSVITSVGITVKGPEIGFGYIQLGESLDEDEAFWVKKFVEKPQLADAESMCNEHFLWNTGIFAAEINVLMAAFQEHLGATSGYFRENICFFFNTKNNVVEIDYELTAPHYASIDILILSLLKQHLAIKASFEWDDAGTWGAISKLIPEHSNHVVKIRTSGCYAINHSKHLVGLVGVEDVIVVNTDDALLVVAKDSTQDVQKLVDELRSSGHKACLEHSYEIRSWGKFIILDEGPNFKVKRLVLNPGRSISLQYHKYRSEYWTVVEGSATYINSAHLDILPETYGKLNVGESVHIPANSIHKLINASETESLVIIEVQNGAILTEDDIVRLDEKP